MNGAIIVEHDPHSHGHWHGFAVSLYLKILCFFLQILLTTWADVWLMFG